MIDFLEQMDSEQVRLGFNGPRAPIIVRPVGDEDYLALVMPMRLAGGAAVKDAA